MVKSATNNINDDSKYGIDALKKIKSISSKLLPQIITLRRRIHSRHLNIFKGEKFIGVKNQLLLDYIANLASLILKKLKCKSIADCGEVDRLIEIRIVMERMRTIEQRLKIEWERKLTQSINNQSDDANLNLRPQMDNLDSNDDDDNDDDNDGDSSDGEEKLKTKKSDEIYRPIKMAPKFYDGDLTKSQKQEKLKEKIRRRAAGSSILRDLKNEFTDAPEEIKDDFDMHRLSGSKKEKEKNEYEESYFTRTQITKKQKMADRKLRTMGSLNSITKFSDIRALMGEEDDQATSFSSKKNKSKKKNSKKRKRFH